MYLYSCHMECNDKYRVINRAKSRKQDQQRIAVKYT